MMSDVQFLAHHRQELGDHAIYLYRQTSWILKHKVRKCLLTIAQHRNWVVLPQEAGLDGFSIFDDVLVFRDLGQKDAHQPADEDLENYLLALVSGLLDRHIFLMVPAGHSIVGTDAWERAIAAENLTYIEEPLVTRANVSQVLDHLAAISDFKKMSQLVRSRGFSSHFSLYVSENGCTITDIVMELDRYVLLPTARAARQVSSHSFGVRRPTFNISLRAFVDRRDEANLRSVLNHVDQLCFREMLDRSELLARLYGATASMVGGRDKRYKRDRGTWTYIAWGMLVLSSDWSEVKDHKRGNVFVTFERICRELMTIADPKAWLRRTDRWQRIANEIVRPADRVPDKAERARLDLVSALRERSALLSASQRWLEILEQESLEKCSAMPAAS